MPLALLDMPEDVLSEVVSHLAPQHPPYSAEGLYYWLHQANFTEAYPDLLNLALTCKGLRVPVQKALLRHVCLVGTPTSLEDVRRQPPSLWKVEAFQRLFSVGDLQHTVSLVLYTLAPWSPPIQTLPNLRLLHLCQASTAHLSPSQLASFVSGLPALKILVLDYCRAAHVDKILCSLSYMDILILRTSFRLSQLEGHLSRKVPLKLDRLVIDMFAAEGPEPFLRSIARDDLRSLTTVELRWEKDEFFPNWLQGSWPCLKELHLNHTVHLSDPSLVATPVGRPTLVCPQLRQLRMPNYKGEPPLDLLRSQYRFALGLLPSSGRLVVSLTARHVACLSQLASDSSIPLETKEFVFVRHSQMDPALPLHRFDEFEGHEMSCLSCTSSRTLLRRPDSHLVALGTLLRSRAAVISCGGHLCLQDADR